MTDSDYFRIIMLLIVFTHNIVIKIFHPEQKVVDDPVKDTFLVVNNRKTLEKDHDESY